jgi:hypothetical protein
MVSYDKGKNTHYQSENEILKKQFSPKTDEIGRAMAQAISRWLLTA